jgi:hypothetical protein
MNLFKLLNANNYVTFNRPLAHAIGLNATMILSELLDKYEYFKNSDQLEEFSDLEGSWFYLTVDAAQERTTLGEKEQRGAIEKLEELGFITKKVKGIPGKRYFRIHEEVIEAYFKNSNKVSRTSQKPDCSLPKANQDPPKSQRIYKEPKEEPNKESSSSPPASDSSLEKMRKNFDCPDEIWDEAIRRCRQKQTKKPGHIGVLEPYLKKVIDGLMQNKNLMESGEEVTHEETHKEQAQEKERESDIANSPYYRVRACREYVEIEKDAHSRQIRYDITDKEWKSQTGWK